MSSEKAESLMNEGSIKRKGKVYRFYSRNGILNCKSIDLHTLNENYEHKESKEIFSLREVCFYEHGLPLFFIFKGFNFSTDFSFNKTKQAFIEKEYDDKYMLSCRQSQVYERAHSPLRLKIGFFINLFILILITILAEILVLSTILIVNSR